MDAVKADKDNDGELDVFALTGNFDDGVVGRLSATSAISTASMTMASCTTPLTAMLPWLP